MPMKTRLLQPVARATRPRPHPSLLLTQGYSRLLLTQGYQAAVNLDVGIVAGVLFIKEESQVKFVKRDIDVLIVVVVGNITS